MTADDDARNHNARITIARLTEELVPTLIARLGDSELGELEVRENGWRVRVRRPVAAPPNGAGADEPKPATNPGAGNPGRQPEPIERHAPRAESPPGALTSPAVGYYAPRDGVAVGTRLRSGDTIGHVDVLGVRKEVVSPLEGTLRALEVEPGQAVEYGQAIGRVEPDVQ